jgi:hypothetical protein
MKEPKFDVYLTLRAVARALQARSLRASSSLYIIKQGREALLSADTGLLLDEIVRNEEIRGAFDLAIVTLKTADPGPNAISRVAWISNWSDRDGSRRSVSYLLDDWKLKSFPIAVWNSRCYPLGFEEAIQSALNASNPGLFRFFL